MPFNYSVDPANQLVTIMGFGPVSMEERVDCVNRMMTDKRISSKHNILINVCEVSNCPAPYDIHSIVSLVERLQSKFGGRVAILNSTVGHVTVSNIIALTACCGDKVQAFLSENEAREWLRGHHPTRLPAGQLTLDPDQRAT